MVPIFLSAFSPDPWFWNAQISRISCFFKNFVILDSRQIRDFVISVNFFYRLCHPTQIYFPVLFTTFSSQILVGFATQNQYTSLHFSTVQLFFQSRPLPASLGNQNRCFLKGISIKIDTFLHPGRSRPARAIKIVTF